MAGGLLAEEAHLPVAVREARRFVGEAARGHRLVERDGLEDVDQPELLAVAQRRPRP
jgi:hypothetical protein